MSEHELDAADLGQVVLHLRYLRADIKTLGSKVSELSGDMATRKELEEVRSELNGKMDKLREEVHAQSASSTFERFLTLTTKVGAAIAALMLAGGSVVALVNFLDRIPAK